MKWMSLFVTLIVSAPALASVSSYLNHNSSRSYTDPYRNISRPGDNLEAVILSHIAAAKKSVYVAVQEFRLPLVAKALIEKHNAGVDVRVVIEHDYNFTVLTQRDRGDGEYEASKVAELRALVDVNRNGKYEKEELETRDAIYMLKDAKVPLLDDSSDLTKGAGLMHHKFVIVDGRTTVVTSANFTLSCIHGDILTSSSRGNANSMLVVESPGFSKMFTDEFKQLWGNGRRGNFGQNKTYRGAQTITVKGVRLTVQFSPTSKRLKWEETVNGLIAQQFERAQQSVKGALFVFSDQKIADAAAELNERGLKLGFLIEPKFAYREYSELLDMLGLEMLDQRCNYEPDNSPWAKPIREAGMAVLPRGDVLHHKFAVIDGKKVIMGSQNWSDAANYTNDETLVVVENKAISDMYTREYDRLRKGSLLGPLSRLKNEIERREQECGR